MFFEARLAELQHEKLFWNVAAVNNEQQADGVFFEPIAPVGLFNAQISLTIVVFLEHLSCFSCFYERPASMDGFGKFKCAFGDVNQSRALNERVETFNTCLKFHISAPQSSIFLLLLHFATKSGTNAFETFIVFFLLRILRHKRILGEIKVGKRLFARLEPVWSLKKHII